jgi:RNA polymerase sigma factor (sigma-70 family)
VAEPPHSVFRGPVSPATDPGVSHITVAELAETTEVRDERSDASVYAALAPELIRFASSLVGPHDAADVLSAAVVRSLSSPRWPDVVNRRAYLYQAVFSEACTWRRRGAQRPGREASLVLPDRWELPGFRPDVAEAVARLSVRQRAVVVLTYWADLDPAAIAVMLDVSEGSVRRHLARARAHLRKVLDA